MNTASNTATTNSKTPDLASMWWFGVVVTSLGRSTKLLYVRPG